MFNRRKSLIVWYHVTSTSTLFSPSCFCLCSVSQLRGLPEDLAAFPDAERHHPHSGPGPQPAVTWAAGSGHSGTPAGRMWGWPFRGGASHGVGANVTEELKTTHLREETVERLNTCRPTHVVGSRQPVTGVTAGGELINIQSFIQKEVTTNTLNGLLSSRLKPPVAVLIVDRGTYIVELSEGTHPCLAFRFYFVMDWECNPMIQCFHNAIFILGEHKHVKSIRCLSREFTAFHAWSNVALLNMPVCIFVHFLT